MIVLDTDVLIEMMDSESAKGRKILEMIKNSGEEVATTTINLHEILYGLLKLRKRDVIQKVLGFNIVEYDKDDAVLSSEIEVKLEEGGEKAARLDCMIAAIAINKGAKLSTLNLKHFEKFKKLGLEIFMPAPE